MIVLVHEFDTRLVNGGFFNGGGLLVSLSPLQGYRQKVRHVILVHAFSVRVRVPLLGVILVPSDISFLPRSGMLLRAVKGLRGFGSKTMYLIDELSVWHSKR